MFTGLVETKGKIMQMQPLDLGLRLEILPELPMNEISIGDSIAINGICLTVTHKTDTTFSTDVMHETIRRTSLSTLNEGSEVNVERAMKADGRFDGHIVQGHVDGVGEIKSIEKEGIAYLYTIEASPHLLKYMVEKGSITLDGISLTLVSAQQMDFSVSIIPHTLAVTNLGSKKVGDPLNMEVDVLAKYVERLMAHSKGD